MSEDTTVAVPDATDIPAELRECEQWLMWDASSDTPRRPHWRGEFKGISWTTPDDWYSFEKAREAALEKDSWGIGYVLANGETEKLHHPRGIYGGLDLDGCLIEEGRPKEWLPSLQPFFDAGGYMEYSPSTYDDSEKDGGIKIPLVGFEPPEWWRDVEFVDRDHEGVEAHDAKFFTVTGEQLDGAGDTVADTGEWVNEWLAQAHKSITGDDPRKRQTEADSPGSNSTGKNAGTGSHGNWMDTETASEALTHVDPDVSYPTWRDIGFALADEFSSGTARSLFEDWLRGGTKWDRDAERQAKRIVEDATTGGGRSISTVVYHAKQGGWDASAAARAATASDGGVEAASPSESTGSDTSAQSPADPDDDAPLPDPTPYGFARHSGGYGYWENGGEDQPDEWTEWTNFQIVVESYLSRPEDGEVFELTIHPRNADEYTVTVEPTAFNERRAFKSEVACGRTTTFTGGETALAKIKQFVGTQTAPEQQGTRHMGHHDDAIVVPGGSLTAEGWADEPRTRYLERSLGIERKVGLSPDADPIPDGELDRERDSDAFETVADILELLPQTREFERFLPALGWFYATPLRSLIAEQTGEFPVLSVTGSTGAGKTSTLETMWNLLGVEGDPFSANDTSFTTMTTVSATDSLPVWFDEYKPADMSPGRLDGFHDTVRKSTRGGVVSKGNADQTTTEYHLRAPVVVSGEQRFAGPAEQRRSILTMFRAATTDPDSDAAQAYAQLTGGSYRTDDGHVEHYDGYDPAVHAHVYHRWLLGYDDEEFIDAWRSAENRVLTLLDDYGLTADSAGRTALQTIVFGITLYRAFADDMGASVPFDDAGRDRALTYVAKQQGGGDDGERESHLDEFVRLLSLAAMDTELEEDTHFTRVHKRGSGDEIRVNISRAYPKVARYVQHHGLEENVELFDEGSYRDRIKDAAADPDSYVSSYSQNSPPIGRAFGIDAHDTDDTVDGFDDDHFYGRDEQAHNGRYESDK